MGKALYRKYRPKNLSELIGQEHITTALGNALKQGAIGHAYLFTGPRGTGKTSTARILAHEVNGLPYDEDQSHLDIIEIDAASNRRIDEIRELRERVHTAPTSAKYKVYIIDEVHMLTKEAFNALLKTLEEPPAHAIFILATTEAHKLPETIISRTQRYAFKPTEAQAVVKHLRSIAKSEKMDITDDALALIAQHGGGSFRDSISLLDQTRNISGTIDAAEVGRLIGIAPAEAVISLWQAIEQQNTPRIIELLGELRAQGYQSGQLAKQLAARFRSALIDGHHNAAKLMQALHELLEVPVSHDADTALELAILRLTLSESASHIATPPAQPRQEHPMPKATDTVTPPAPAPKPPRETPKPTASQPPVTDTEPPKSVDAVVEAPKPAVIRDLDDETWHQIVEAVKQRHKPLYTVIRMAKVDISDDTITLAFKFGFHQKRISEAKNKQTLIDVIKEQTGKSFTLNLTVATDAEPTFTAPPTAAAQAPSASLEVVTNVFGGGEILDS